jgi:hypothetical protein
MRRGSATEGATKATVIIAITLNRGRDTATAKFEIPDKDAAEATAFYLELQRRLSEWMLTKDEGAASDAGADKECE